MPNDHGALIEKLGERGFAGGNVAASPGRPDDPFWPVGPSPSGVAELIELILQASKGKGKLRGESHWAFLLGGAGNGKSFAARTLIDKLLPSVKGKRKLDLPKRKYAFKLGDASVCVINDATIASRDEYALDAGIALAKDVASWARQAKSGRSLAFACVNRGIVLEELNTLSRADHKSLAFSKAVLSWLEGAETEIFQDGDAFPWVQSVEGSPAGSWYRRLRLRISRTTSIVVHALSVDVGSLFEHGAGSDVDVLAEGAVVRDIKVANDFRDSAAQRVSSVAGKLVSDLLGKSLGGVLESRPALCPIRANLSTLAFEDARASWLTLLRGAEVAAGRQVTYRDFWGLVALSLAGPRTVSPAQGGNAAGVVGEVDRLLEELASAQSTEARLGILGKLSVRRLHLALFRGEAPPLQLDSAESPPDFPTSRGLVLIDPAADVTSHSTVVEHALEHLSLGGKPSDYVFERVPAFRSCWQPFDEAIEEAVIAFLDSEESADTARRRVISWFSGYLQRAIGCYVGGIGHEAVISAWYRCWHAAGAARPQFPSDLNLGLRTLLLPVIVFQNNVEKQLAVPAFASRAVPFESVDSAEGKLVLGLDVDHLRLRPTRQLDRLRVELHSTDAAAQAHSPLDFSILREALACKSSHYGFTESGAKTAPRLERARAAMMSVDSSVPSRFALVSGGKFKELAR